jgi:hypothetical protein
MYRPQGYALTREPTAGVPYGKVESWTPSTLPNPGHAVATNIPKADHEPSTPLAPRLMLQCTKRCRQVGRIVFSIAKLPDLLWARRA